MLFILPYRSTADGKPGATLLPWATSRPKRGRVQLVRISNSLGGAIAGGWKGLYIDIEYSARAMATSGPVSVNTRGIDVIPSSFIRMTYARLKATPQLLASESGGGYLLRTAGGEYLDG